MFRHWWRWAPYVPFVFLTALWLWLDLDAFAPLPLDLQSPYVKRSYLGEYGRLTWIEEELDTVLFRFRGELEPDVRVIYVDVDSYSIDKLGNMPWDRAWFAEVCDALLTEGGVRAIGIDFVFSEQGQPRLLQPLLLEGNERMAALLHEEPRIVLASSYSSAVFVGRDGRPRTRILPLLMHGLPPREEIEPPELPELVLPPREGMAEGWAYQPASMGLIDALGGDVRWVPAFTPPSLGYERFLHLSVELVLRYWGLDAEDIRVAEDRMELRTPEGEVRRTIPLTRGQLLQVNWFSPWDAEQNLKVPFAEALQQVIWLHGENEEGQRVAREFFAQFEDAVVLIGPVDPLLQDIAPTPFDRAPVPRVGLHGNLVKSIVTGAFIHQAPRWTRAMATGGLALLVTLLAVLGGTQTWTPRLLAVAVTLAYVAAVFHVFRMHGVRLPLVAPMGAAFSSSFVAALMLLVAEQRQKRRIRGLFGTYLSPQLVTRMVESGEDPRLGGAEQEITAYFSDIQSFSSISEVLAPGPLVELMNEYLTACTEVVQSEGGTLDKYIGDAVVAIYGAPIPLADHAARACRAALRVQERQAELRKRWREDGRNWPEKVRAMRTRIGLNSGRAVVGNVGSLMRFNYTMMGDTVNLAARMESGAKHFGVYTLVTEATVTAARAGAGPGGLGIVFRPIDLIEVVGRSEPVRIYELWGREGSESAEEREGLEVYAAAMLAYAERKWSQAYRLFEQAALLERHRPGRDAGIKTNPSLVLGARCRDFLKEPPPEDWDGVLRMTEK